MNESRTTSPALIYIAWAVVILPLLWGLGQTFVKVAELFR
jgi:hypothetical protein